MDRRAQFLDRFADGALDSESISPVSDRVAVSSTLGSAGSSGSGPEVSRVAGGDAGKRSSATTSSPVRMLPVWTWARSPRLTNASTLS